MDKQKQIQFIEDNYPLYTNHISNRRIRHDFFSKIETELQSYLLGFYAADGSIDEKRKTLRIHLSSKDSEIVYLYKDVISPDARTFTVSDKLVKGRNGMIVQGHNSFGVDITSAKICESLVSLGLGYRKTYCELSIPNQIPKDLIRHFIRGYFDGDGCITGYIVKEANKSPRVRSRFDIDAKTNHLLNEFLIFFANNNIKLNINYLKRDNMYRLTTSSKKELKKIFHFLYDNSYFYLSRKFDKFSYYVNTEVSQIITDHCNAQEVNVNESNNPPKSAEHPLQDENIC